MNDGMFQHKKYQYSFACLILLSLISALAIATGVPYAMVFPEWIKGFIAIVFCTLGAQAAQDYGKNKNGDKPNGAGQ
jgi:predicted Na+-dependent transporter